MKSCVWLTLAMVLAAANPVTAIDFSLTWSTSWDGENLADVPAAMAVDQLGNIYVVGQTTSHTESKNIVLIKYHSSLARLWSQIWNGKGWGTTGDETACAIAIDPGNNPVLVGRAFNGVSYDVVVIKYRPNSDSAWVVWVDTPEHANESASDLAIDSAGNIYVAGNVAGASALLFKLDSSGSMVWLRRYDSPDPANDVAQKVVIDPYGDVLIGGSSAITMSVWAFFTVKYTQAGDTLWSRRFNPGLSDQYTMSDLTVSPNGDVYVTGTERCMADICFWSQFETVKYSPNGSFIWAREYGAGLLSYWRTSATVPVSDGGIVVTGQAEEGSGVHWETIRYSPSGDLVWRKSYGAPGAYVLGNKPNSMTTDATGNIYITGALQAGSTGTDLAVVHYTLDGTKSWSNVYNGPANRDDAGHAISLSPDGRFYAAGTVNNPDGDIVVLRYDRCCVAQTGNVDCDSKGLVDISDLSALIDHLFISFTPPCCTEQANVDGLGGIDISDLSALINHLFISMEPLAACP